MIRIPCINCGVRDEEEFTFGGPSHVTRPRDTCADAEWADYLFNRDNPKGIHYEHWCHTYGCGRWFNIARNTVTHDIVAVYGMSQSKPVLKSSIVSGHINATLSTNDRLAETSNAGGARK